MMTELKQLASKIPSHLIIEKALWVGDIKIDINHIDNDFSKPLDYITAFKKMIEKLKIDINVDNQVFPEDEWII